MSVASTVRDEQSTQLDPIEREPRDHRRKLLRRLWVLMIVGFTTVIVAALVGSVYGLTAGGAVVVFVTTLCGLAKGLVELHLLLEKHDTEGGTNVLPRRRTRELLPVVVTALLIGIVVGLIPVPWLLEKSQQPSASLRIPSRVEINQLATITWHNVAATDDVRVVVLAKGSNVNFIQPCRSSGSRRGVMSCELGIGGRDDAGNLFEVRVVRLPHKLSEQFAASSAEVFYPAVTPEEMQVIDSVVVTRI